MLDAAAEEWRELAGFTDYVLITHTDVHCELMEAGYSSYLSIKHCGWRVGCASCLAVMLKAYCLCNACLP